MNTLTFNEHFDKIFITDHDENKVRREVRNQYRFENDLAPPNWLTGDKRKWWVDEANKIKGEMK